MNRTLEQICNEIEIGLLIQWCRMANRELIIEDGKITKVISLIFDSEVQ